MTQLYGRLAFVSASIGFILLVALHFLKPELDPDWHMVSEYALGNHGWAMTMCFSCLSLSCISLVFATFRLLRTTSGKIGLVLLLCAAAGLGLAALFPTDPIAVHPDLASRSARIHGLSVMVGVPTLTLAALLISMGLAKMPMWADRRTLVLGAAHAIWISLAMTVAVVAIWLPGSGGFGPEVPVGWPNRFMFVSYFGWLGTLSWPLIRSPGVSE
jgi:hypothetical protein